MIEQQHQSGGREGLVDSECVHRSPDGEQLAEPAQSLERHRGRGGERCAHDRETASCFDEEQSYTSEPVTGQRVVTAGRCQRERERRQSEPEDDREGHECPVRNLRRDQDPGHECDRREEIEHPMGEDSADQRCPQAFAPGKPPQSTGRRPVRSHRPAPGEQRSRTSRRRMPRKRGGTPDGVRGSPGGSPCSTRRSGRPPIRD